MDFSEIETRTAIHLDRAGQPWTADEEKQLKLLHRNGKAIHNIARRFGRTEGAINARLMKLGLIENPHKRQYSYCA